MKNNFNDGMEVMISDYIENNLSKLDKENFEKYMKNNIEFSSLVNSIKINKSVMSNEPYVIPSKDFLINLNDKITNLKINKKKYWFGLNYKYSLSFSFVIIFMSLLFINKYYNIESEDKIDASIRLIEKEKLTIKDSLNIIEADNYLILQVKGTEKK
tara:strand:- start:33 stop:503 length:471 start_codon:yes stop_codon:yes gene_type:complete